MDHIACIEPVTKTALYSGANYLRHGGDLVTDSQTCPRNQRICGGPFLARRFWRKILFAQFLEIMQCCIPQLSKLQDLTFQFGSSGSRELPGLQPCLYPGNSMLLVRDLCQKLLLWSTWCALYDVRVPERGGSCRFLCLCMRTCSMPTAVKVVVILQGTLRDRRDSQADNENASVQPPSDSSLLVLHLALTSCEKGRQSSPQYEFRLPHTPEGSDTAVSRRTSPA